jgi:hypothetical protein
LSTARDTTRTAVKDDIAPAVVAALGAARDASAPLRAEAAARAGDAAKAVRSSDLAKNVRQSDLAKKAQRRAADLSGNRTRSRGKKVGIIAGVVALGAAAYTVLKRGAKPTGPSTAAYPAPMAPPTDATTDAPIDVTDPTTSSATPKP